MTAEILCVGTELLLGDIVNTNAAFLSRELARIGVGVYCQTVVGDNAKRLEESLALALSRADIVVMTGGLGPTYDDLTKETVAAYFKLPMERDEKALEQIKCFFHKIGREMTRSNEKQAEIPKGADVFYNKWGTAPGLAVSQNGQTVIMLPGPPSEMKPMFAEYALPYLEKQSGRVFLSRTVRLFGIGESALEDLLHDKMSRAKNPTIAPYAGVGEVSLRITASGADQEACERLIEPVLQEITEQVHPYIYGVDVPNMQFALVRLLQERKWKIATAESCTGGLLSARITEIDGASEVFDCGVCSYANEIKQSVLGVSAETLEQYGAVSRQTAAQMAAGIRKLAKADIGISTTGIAGPGGGTPEKPVGTVYVGIDSEKVKKVLHLKLAWRNAEDERQTIRHRTALHAFFEALRLAKEV
ncbi:MAG TPA: competence/damage-inducible protein A [Clostridiales bacterium]|nr:competence/damage-inducible protein A [Clostridiales bacterium]